MPAMLTPPQHPAVQLLTAEEFLEQFGDRHFELVKGIPEELPMPNLRHGKICYRITMQLGQFVEALDLGHLMTNDSLFLVRRNPDTLRGPDVCFISYARLPKGPVPDGLLDVIPELAVEVKSPGDLWTKIYAKVGEYLDAGVLAVVIVDAQSQTASVYRSAVRQETFEMKDVLTLPDLLPGFALPLATLFN